MEFIERNYVVTTGSISVDSNTTTAKNIYNWDQRFQYVSDGYNDDLTSTTFTYSFDETTTVSRIALLEHNLKSFTIYYNGATASTFAMSTTAATSASDFSSNSASAHYFITDAVACTSVSIQMKSTIEADNEKAIGVLVLSRQKLDFDRIPAASGYNPDLKPKQITHKMSDGGVRRHRSHDKWSAKLSFTDVTLSFRDSLKTIYDTDDSFIYVPFGTSTAWDKVIFDAVWSNSFNFYKYAENSTVQGFTGKINLMERA